MNQTPNAQREKHYQNLAKRFIRMHLTESEEFDPVDIFPLLLMLSLKYARGYWLQLRNALTYYVLINGDPDIAEDIHNLTFSQAVRHAAGERQKVELNKRKIRKSVSTDEHKTIMSELLNREKKNLPLIAVVSIIKELGIRPAEIPALKFNHTNNSIYVVGAKKTRDDLRGLDRKLTVDQHIFKRLLAAHQKWLEYKSKYREKSDHDAMKLLQNQFAYRVKCLWPDEPCPITFKTYRHQFSANLKASKIDRATAAAFMGHQSIMSLSCYGYARNGNKVLNLTVDKSAIASVRMPKLKSSSNPKNSTGTYRST